MADALEEFHTAVERHLRDADAHTSAAAVLAARRRAYLAATPALTGDPDAAVTVTMRVLRTGLAVLLAEGRP